MEYIKTYESFNLYNNDEMNDEMNEGLKTFLIGGLIALSTLLPNTANATNIQSSNGENYKIELSENDNVIINGFLKYYKNIISQKDNVKFSKDGNYIITQGSNFNSSSKENTSGYNLYSSFTMVGDEKSPDAQINITLKDDGTISLMFGEGAAKGGTTKIMGKTSNVDYQKMSQVEISKGEHGYDEANNLLMFLMQK
jgi:hypothetical protein